MAGRSSLDKIVAAFAEAIAAGDFEEAEGWFSVARLNAGRELEPTPTRPRARSIGRPRRRF